MPFRGWFCLLLGAAFLVAAAVLGVLAVDHATEISAYRHARECLANAPADADCLQSVHGRVSAVTESPASGRIPADYMMDVQTASTTLHLTFASDSPMLSYAVDGDPAVVTTWRGIPLSVVTDGRSEVTTSVPETSLARHLGNSQETGAFGVFLVLAAVAVRRNRRSGSTRPMTSPSLTALIALVLGSVVVEIGGIALDGKPSRLGPDLAATVAAVAVVLVLSVWAGMSAIWRPREADAPPARTADTAVPQRTRRHPATWPGVLRAHAAGFLAPALTMAVLFGVVLSIQDGPPARAFRLAPACVGETNLATCVGDFTAVVNGVRTPANNSTFASVSYVTRDGAINTWVEFDGNATAIARMATADENARTPRTIRIWGRSIIGADLGGSWHWAGGNPPGDTIPVVFLAASFGLLMFCMRLRIHLRALRTADHQGLLIDDIGQVATAAGSVALLAYGFWPGAILAVVALMWLALSARQSTRPPAQAQLTSLPSA